MSLRATSAASASCSASTARRARRRVSGQAIYRQPDGDARQRAAKRCEWVREASGARRGRDRAQLHATATACATAMTSPTRATVVEAVDVPVIASGGAGAPEHFREAFEAGASGALAATVFHDRLIAIPDLKEFSRHAGSKCAADSDRRSPSWPGTRWTGSSPRIVQDARRGEVLMLGYMNRDALEATLGERVRDLLQPVEAAAVAKGETSGNRLRAGRRPQRLRRRRFAGARATRKGRPATRHAQLLRGDRDGPAGLRELSRDHRRARRLGRPRQATRARCSTGHRAHRAEDRRRGRRSRSWRRYRDAPGIAPRKSPTWSIISPC